MGFTVRIVLKYEIFFQKRCLVRLTNKKSKLKIKKGKIKRKTKNVISDHSTIFLL